MDISQVGVDLIKRFEGLSLEAYADIAGIWTIGYGHTGKVQEGDTITEAEAEEILRKDIERFVSGVDKAVHAPVTQNQFDALISLSFNIGLGAFGKSTALKLLNKEDYIGAAEAITWWNKATVNGVKQEVRGLVVRRAAEAELFLKDVSVDGDLIEEEFEDSTRITPEENLPRRGHLGQSRTIEGATIAGAAGAAGAGATMIGDGEAPTGDPGDGSSGEGGIGNDAGSPPAPEIACMTAEDLANMRDGEIAIPEGTPLCSEVEQPAPQAPSASSSISQGDVATIIQLIAFAVVILMVLYIMYARFDDWRKYRR